MLFQGATAQQSITLDNLRFVSDRGVVTAASSILPAGERGTLRADFGFQSDTPNGEGRYEPLRMRAFWKFADAHGRPILFNEVDNSPDDAWCGRADAVDVQIVELDATTGAGTASLSIPIGGKGVRGRFPLLFDGSITMSLACGWQGQMGMASNGQPTNALCTSTQTLTASWPDVWVGSELPQGGPQIGDDTFEFRLKLKTLPSSARTFTITAQPAGIVEVLSPTLTIGVTRAFRTFRIKAQAPGSFALVVKEGGNVVAKSAVMEAGPAVSHHHGDSGVQTFVSESAGEHSAELRTGGASHWLKECTPASGLGCTTGSVSACGGCQAEPVVLDTCAGEGATAPSTFTTDGSCSFAFDGCTYTTGTVAAAGFTFSSKERVSCGSITQEIHYAPFGFGGTTTVTVNYSATCCMWTCDPAAGTTNVTVLDCF
jgi:hypothetical protein